MFKVSPASLQTFIDTPNCVLKDRVHYSTVQIPNVFCDGNLQIINIFACFLYYNDLVYTRLSPLIMIESVVIKSVVVRYLHVR
jgi:hypothetical protein